MSAGAQSTTPSIGADHPAALAFHCLNNASQILRGDYLDIAGIDRVRELLDEGTVAVGALHVLCERQERYATKAEEKNSELVQSIINLTRQLDEAHAVIERMHAPDERGRAERPTLAPSSAAARGLA